MNHFAFSQDQAARVFSVKLFNSGVDGATARLSRSICHYDNPELWNNDGLLRHYASRDLDRLQLVHCVKEINPFCSAVRWHWIRPVEAIEALHCQLHLDLDRLPPTTWVIQLGYP